MMRRAWLAAAAFVVLLVGIGAGLLTARLQAPRPTAQVSAARSASTPGPTDDSWWKPLPIATAAFVPRQLVIDRLRVKAPIEVKGVDARNVMEAPDVGSDAAWYRFTPQPGAGGNAVFAGHRDFGRLGNPAIFWRLDQLAAGDLIRVVSPEQTEIRYRVTQSWDYNLGSIPMAKVLATDRVDEVTLITCAGAFTRGTGYDHRLVVRAVRIA